MKRDLDYVDENFNHKIFHLLENIQRRLEKIEHENIKINRRLEKCAYVSMLAT